MRTVVIALAGLSAAAIALVVVARFLFSLPPQTDIPPSQARPASPDSPLANAVSSMAGAEPGKTGVFPLVSGRDAFLARMLLAEQAADTIDAQYYIWHDDLTGIMLLSALRRAAERGVRVRLLVDDNGVSNLDAELSALDALPEMEVRLFNPFVLRQPKLLNYTFDFFRLNHRMHNKSFTVDGTATVIGGRNIGDEYFDTGPDSNFLDLDVLAVGDVVPDVSTDFDLYWASASAYPVASIVAPAHDGLQRLDSALEAHSATDRYESYRSALGASQLIENLRMGTLPLEWTDVRLVSDDPAKAQREARREDLMISRLFDLLGTPAKSLDLVSAYFVPGAQGTSQLTGLQAAGVDVRILTNSYEATDVALVHSGYTKYRKELLRSGAGLFELKAGALPATGREELGPFGSSGASLHAKTFAVDGRHVFIGSFNFDPRSALLNTEMGLMIESPSIAGAIGTMFDTDLANICYRPLLADGELQWIEIQAGGEATHTVEPGTSFMSRAILTVAGWLPLEWLL
ncbi:MAG: phospholipase D family protein [Rhizobiaceae bacterium]|nr:phospholipase D family protein [Rhizobiaceae bacterium]